MAESITCPDCGEVAESAADLEIGEPVPEMETTDDGSIHLYENRDRFLCSNCRKTLGVSRPSAR